MTKRKKIALVDGNSYIHRAYHAIRELRNSRGLPTNAIYGFLTMITKVLREEKPDLAAVVFDAGGTTFRHELFKEYKATRPPMPDDLAVQVDYIHRLTRAFGLAVFEQRGIEADDLLATLGRRAEAAGLEVLYITGDKDIHQLIDTHASTLDTMKEKRLTLESFREERGLEPGQLPELMALTGDSSDNIPGVRGIGPKTGEKLIKEYGTLEGVYAHLEEMPEGKVKEALKTHRAEAELSRRLVTLKDDLEIPVEWDRLEPRPDTPALKAMFEELEFRKLARELDLGEESPAVETQVIDDPREVAKWLKQASAEHPISLAVAPAGGSETVVALTRDGHKVALAGLSGEHAGELKKLLEDRHVPKEGYDFKASLHRLAKAGVTLHGLDLDVLIAAYVLDPSEKENTLADLERTWLGSSSREEEAAGPPQGGLFEDGEAVRRRVAREAAVVHRLGRNLRGKLADTEMEKLYREVELPLIGILADMETVGIGIDRDALREMSKEMAIILQQTEQRIHALAGVSFNLGSPKQLAEILFERLKLPVVKKTKTGYSTDEEVLTQLAPQHEIPSLLLSHRQLSKLRNTYVDVLPQLVSPVDGRIHTTFNQAATATGRLSSSGPNLQNIPVRTEWGMRIRRAFVPAPGWKFIAADYSQIELRILAHLSGDEKLRDAFRHGEDIHTATAVEIFKVEPAGVTKEMRRAAKVINFGILYGMSPFGLARELGVDQKEAKKYIDDYFAVYTGVRRYLDELVAGARQDGFVTTLFGRRRQLRELQSSKPQVVAFAERAALNTPLQGTAADLIKKAMIALHKRLAKEHSPARMLVQIHDELLLEAPRGEVERTSALVRECMEGAAAFKVPIVVDIDVGDTWGDLA